MAIEPDITPVLAEYPANMQPTRRSFLGGAGGFSGSLLWRLDTPEGELCLRRWPTVAPRSDVFRLRWIHRFLKHVHAQGFSRVPLPRQAAPGRTAIEHDGSCWDLSTWMPGQPDRAGAPCVARLQASMIALAEFHGAAATMPGGSKASGRSTGIGLRSDMLERMLANELAPLRHSIVVESLPELAHLALRYYDLAWSVAPMLVVELRRVVDQRVPVAVCLRDIWRDNVLFVGNDVSAFVDFGAIAFDSVAGDIARLLGSFVADDRAAWQSGLTAYESVRPLSTAERWLVDVFDRANVTLSGLNWIRWVFQERRTFENRAAVEARLEHFLQRLEHLRGPSCRRTKRDYELQSSALIW